MLHCYTSNIFFTLIFYKYTQCIKNIYIYLHGISRLFFSTILFISYYYLSDCSVFRDRKYSVISMF